MPQGKLGPALEEMKVLLAADGDFLRRLVQAVQELLKAETTEALQAANGERTAARLSYRSSYYDRTLVSRDGSWSCACRRIVLAVSRPSWSSATRSRRRRW
jgi:transposase-like protein